jgi:beta-galactosidase
MTTRERLLMDFEWRFHLGNASDPAKDFDYGRGDPSSNTKAGDAVGAVRPDFDDGDWALVDLPHDWAVESGFKPEADEHHGYRPLGREWPSTSIGWYRKAFSLSDSDRDKRLYVQFDGAYRDSIVWLNGHYLGRHLSGYTGFEYDITDCANLGGENVLVVRVDASQFEMWSYEGAGIYRHVWLVKADPLHVPQWGTCVTSTVQGKPGQVRVEVTIETKIANECDEDASCKLVSAILDADGKVVGQVQTPRVIVEAWDTREIVQQVILQDPILWSVDSPYLYRIATTVQPDAADRSGRLYPAESKVVDTYETTFGVRTIRFDADRGFFLNGRPLKIKGVCCHQDHAGVGVALPDRIQQYRIEKLKEMGCNAYRCAHNPSTPELLDVCDRLGMLVVDEHRMMGSSPQILGQLKSLILRDRNHPSVILWSLGNEEHAIQGTDVGARIAATMKRLVRRLDPTRPVTLAMNGAWGSQVSQIMDVQSCNYIACGDADKFHSDFSDQPMIGSETASTLSTRGIYEDDEKRGYVNAFGTTVPSWGASAEASWRFWTSRSFVGGVFVWSGFDYRGEPTPYGWPAVVANFGIMDVCGFPKDVYHYYQSWWSDRRVLHVFPHWNWPGKEGQDISVWCYSNCDEVELLLNGKSLGRKRMARESHLEWQVAYAPGKLEARGYEADCGQSGGQQVASRLVETTGAATGLRLTPDRAEIRADGEDVSMVTVAVVDAEGRVVPTALNEVAFTVSDKARIIGVANGDPSSHEPDKAESRRAFNGLCMAIVQSSQAPGEIRLTAESPGLESAGAIICAAHCECRPFVHSGEVAGIGAAP